MCHRCAGAPEPPKDFSPCISSANAFALAIFVGLGSGHGQATEDLMDGVISDLKAQARILHRQIGQRDSQAVTRTRQLPEFRDYDLASLLASVKRRHCLAIVARELASTDGHTQWVLCAALNRPISGRCSIQMEPMRIGTFGVRRMPRRGPSANSTE